MNHMVVNFHPFTLNQNIVIYSDGNIVEETSVEVSRLSDVVRGLQKRYNVSKIDLIGNKDYLQRFKAEIGTNFTDDCDVNILMR